MRFTVIWYNCFLCKDKLIACTWFDNSRRAKVPTKLVLERLVRCYCVSSFTRILPNYQIIHTKLSLSGLGGKVLFLCLVLCPRNNNYCCSVTWFENFFWNYWLCIKFWDKVKLVI